MGVSDADLLVDSIYLDTTHIYIDASRIQSIGTGTEYVPDLTVNIVS